jgi:integrase
MLTDRECRAALATGGPRKLFDAHGLFLLVSPSGHKSWKLKYRFAGKERKLTLGPYPEVKLSEARARALEARALLRRGIDPGRRAPGAAPQAPTFGEAARKWLGLQEEGWKPKHARTVAGRIEDDLLPVLGPMALGEIRPRDILAILEAVQARGAIELAHRLRQYAAAIFDCAIALDWAETNPAASLSRGLIPARSRRYPALTRIEECRAFLRALEAEPGQPTTRLASRLLALTAVRPGNVRWATRDEFEGLGTAAPLWRIPAAKMKLERALAEQEAFDFVVPLAPQAVAVVEVAIAFAGRRKYLFPSSRHPHRPISENALSTAYARVPGFAGRHVPHGWRASFSTIMNERASDHDRPGDRAIIDLMLAHRQQGVEAIYNRAAYMKRRRELACEWAALLDVGLVPPEALIEGRRKR